MEFDYCCVRAVLALREQGYETIMVNSNPETVSTDFDISDKLFFEPLTLEDVLEIVEREQPVGVIVQLGGQTPLKLTRALEAAGVRILGTSPDSIDIAEDRRRFEKIARELGIEQPANGTATSVDEAVAIADSIGYPVLVRPSYVLGGRAMEIVHDAASLRDYFERAARVSARSARCWLTASSRTRSKPTSMRCATAPTWSSAASWSTSRVPAFTPATRRACCRRISSRPPRWSR